MIGARVGAQIKSQGVSNGKYYYKTFTNYGGPNPSYCEALQKTPPDTSVCSPKGKKDTDPAKIGMVKFAELGRGGVSNWHMMNYDLGDKWTGHDWPGGLAKREEQTREVVQEKQE